MSSSRASTNGENNLDSFMEEDNTERDSGDRREIRHKYRELMQSMQQNREDMLSSRSNRLTETLQQANKLFEGVSKAREAALDAQLLVLASNLGKEKASQLRADLTVFDPTSFAEDVLSFMGINRLESPDSDSEEEGLAKGYLPPDAWHKLGTEATKHFKRTPTFHFMLGSFKTEPPVVRQRIDRQRRASKVEEKRVMPAQVDLFEGLVQGGNLTPEEQQQAVRELRGSLDVLERRYLQAQEQNRHEQRHTGRPSQELDDQRELEEAIFQLGVQLDELQERVDHCSQFSPSTDLTHSAHHLDNAPLPSAVVPVPAAQTPYPQVTSPVPPALPGTGIMGTTAKEDPEEYLPQPVRHKHMQLEKDYGTLLSTYSSFKSLPDALGLEQDEWPQQLPQIARPHDHQESSTGQGQIPASKSQDPAQGRRAIGLMTPVSTQSLPDYAQAVNSQDHQLQTKAKHQSPRTSQQQPRSVTLRNLSPAGSPTDDMGVSSPTGGTNVSVTPLPTEWRRASSVSSRYGVVPDEENPSSRRSVNDHQQNSVEGMMVTSKSFLLIFLWGAALYLRLKFRSNQETVCQ